MAEFVNKHFIVVGGKGSGKSHFCKKLLEKQPNHAVYDVQHEYPIDYNIYRPKNTFPLAAATITELDNFCSEYIVPRSGGLVQLLIIEEAHRFAPNKGAMSPMMMKLATDSRHMGLSIGFVTQRPSWINTSLVSLANVMFIFRIDGMREAKMLNEYQDGLGDAALNLQDHAFIFVDENKKWQVMNAV